MGEIIWLNIIVWKLPDITVPGDLQSWEIGDRENRSVVTISLFKAVEIEQKVGMWGDKAMLIINLV